MTTPNQPSAPCQCRRCKNERQDGLTVGGIDGADLQEIAVRHGLLTLKNPPPTESCGEDCGCAQRFALYEFAEGIDCYERTYKRALSQPQQPAEQEKQG